MRRSKLISALLLQSKNPRPILEWYCGHVERDLVNLKVSCNFLTFIRLLFHRSLSVP